MLEELEKCKTCSGGIEFCRANFVEHCDAAKESRKGHTPVIQHEVGDLNLVRLYDE